MGRAVCRSANLFIYAIHFLAAVVGIKFRKAPKKKDSTRDSKFSMF